ATAQLDEGGDEGADELAQPPVVAADGGGGNGDGRQPQAPKRQQPARPAARRTNRPPPRPRKKGRRREGRARSTWPVVEPASRTCLSNAACRICPTSTRYRGVMVDDVSWLKEYIRDIPDFPRPGVVFRDITPLLADVKAFRVSVDGLC